MMRILFIVSCLAILIGCQLQAQQPALLAEPSKYSSSQIRLIIEEALNTKSVLISQSAFTQSSHLTVQRRPQRMDDGSILFNETEAPEHFMLSKTSDACLVSHKKSQKQWYLKKVDCIAAEDGKP